MKKFFVISATLLTMSASAHAACVDTFGIGARATALGGAYTATANDPFATYYNPAGLTQIDAPMLSAGVTMMDPSLKRHKFEVENKNGGLDFGPKNTTDESDDLFAPHAGYAMPIGKNLALGIAGYVPYGLDIEWSKNTDKNPSAYNFFHSYYIREVVSPTVAYKINNKFSLGFGVSIGKSKSGAERVIYYPTTGAAAASQASSYVTGKVSAGVSQQTGIPAAALAGIASANNGTLPQTKPAAFAAMSDAQYQAVASGYNTAYNTGYSQLIGITTLANSVNNSIFEAEMEDDVNYSFNAGFMYKPTESVALGLTYRSKADAEFDGDIKINGSKVAKVKMDYDHPDQIQAGIRYRPHDKISMEADLVWTYWRHNEYQTEYFTPYLIVPGVDHKTYDRDWKNTNQLRLGIEWQALDFLAVRAGYFYDPTPIPDDSFDMMWPDADRKTYSIGLGFNFDENWTLDTTIQYAIAEASRVIGGESDNLNSTYNPLVKYGIDTGSRNVNLECDGHLFGYSATVNYKF